MRETDEQDNRGVREKVDRKRHTEVRESEQRESERSELEREVTVFFSLL